MQKQKKRGNQVRTKRLHSKLLVIAVVLFVGLLSFRMVSLTGSAGEASRQITQKQEEAALLQKQNARMEDELRQIKEGSNIRQVIERIARELGLIYPGERVFKAQDTR